MGYKTIFHIDDDDDDIEFFIAAIKHISDDANCFSFTNAGRALQKLVTGELIPEIIFLDLNMPMINGQEFLSAFKAISPIRDIPVIVLTTSSDPEKINQLKAQGANGFLTKPSSIKELVNILRPYLT